MTAFRGGTSRMIKAPFSAMPPEADSVSSTQTEAVTKSSVRRAISSSADSAGFAPLTSWIQPRTLKGRLLDSLSPAFPHATANRSVRMRGSRVIGRERITCDNRPAVTMKRLLSLGILLLLAVASIVLAQTSGQATLRTPAGDQ